MASKKTSADEPRPLKTHEELKKDAVVALSDRLDRFGELLLNLAEAALEVVDEPVSLSAAVSLIGAHTTVPDDVIEQVLMAIPRVRRHLQ